MNKSIPIDLKTSAYIRQRFFCAGFTISELLIVSAIVGILASIGLTAYSGYIETSNAKVATNNLKLIALAQSEFKSDFGYYFCGLSTQSDHSTYINNQLFSGENVITSEAVSKYSYKSVGLASDMSELSDAACTNNESVEFLLKAVPTNEAHETVCLNSKGYTDC